MSATILVVGSLNVDMTTYTSRIPEAGETLTASQFNIRPGGKGANQAVACARLTRDKPASDLSLRDRLREVHRPMNMFVVLIGAVGGDVFWPIVLKPELQRSGVRTEGIQILPDGTTGVACILVEEDKKGVGENRILVTPGANWTGMGLNGNWYGVNKRIRHTMQGLERQPDVMVLQCEIPTDTVVGLLRQTREKNKKVQEKMNREEWTDEKLVDVVFNPAPVPKEGLPDDVFDGLQHLIVNETETKALCPPQEDIQDQDLEFYDYGLMCARVVSHFHALGVRTIVVTLGEHGAYYSTLTGGGDNPTAQFLPAEQVKAVETTAAGDTFVGMYAADIAKFKHSGHPVGLDDIERVVSRAQKAASLCVQKRGAMDSIPWRDEVFPGAFAKYWSKTERAEDSPTDR